MENRYWSLDILWKVLLSLILLFFALFEARGILIPFVFSVFIALILNPVVSFLNRKGLNRVLAILLTLLSVAALFGTLLVLTGSQAKNLFIDFPLLVERLKLYIETKGALLQSELTISNNDQLEMLKQTTNGILSTGSSIFSDALSVTSDLFTFISLVPIYIFFMLLYKDNLKRFLVVIGERNKNSKLLDVSRSINYMVRNYIAGLLLVISILATLNTIGFLALGIQYAVFLGVVSAALSVIPYVGNLIGGTLPFVVALITKDSFWYAIGVVAVVGFIQFLEGNFITPKVIGSKVNINPLAAIIALIIGGTLWGIIGMILAIPLIGMVKIIMSNTTSLQPYSILLQDQEAENG
ncbi:MAG: AI-2E family transporter [Verrucomicrobia bacterium]|nr:AI-2E family transporter [Verrucomicrobiota bacterium]